MNNTHNNIVSLVWSIADDVLRDVFLRGQYRDVILPMVVLRRLDALLEPTKTAVDEELENSGGIIDSGVLCDITGLAYYNTSKWTLNRLKSHATDKNDILRDNFMEYLNGYSDNVKDVLDKFEFYAKIKKLADNDRLLAIIEKITDTNLNLTDREAIGTNGNTLPAMSNVDMGTVFEELLRRFNEENNDEAGEHFTPRDVINLLAHLVFEPIKDNLPQIISLYDPACGSGGMLTEGREYLLSIGVQESAIQLSGIECNPETYAICKSDLIIKGVNPEGIRLGNTITDNVFKKRSFGFTITNPPYGKSWKTEKEKIYHDKTLKDDRFELPLTDFCGNENHEDCTPRTSDGQLLFMLEEVDKMKPHSYQPMGSRIASIHNGSSLFTGDAGSGESNIRRYVVENDFVDAIIQLPNNIFYNTGISTYVWILTNKKADHRKGKIQLIDASQAFDKLRKNLGSRNCTVQNYRDQILKTYMDFKETDGVVASKIFNGDDFRFYNVTIERPLRLRSQFNALLIDEMLFDSSNLDLSKWLYETYKERVFEGLNSEVAAIKEYLQETEIKVTDKKLLTLIDPTKWKERKAMMGAAHKLMKHIGTQLFTDYNIFFAKVVEANKSLKLGVKDAVLRTIARAVSVTDPNAAPVVKKLHKANSKNITTLTENFGVKESVLADYGFFPDGKNYIEYETDSDLRDTEKIPVKEDIYNYFQREVRPYVADAWINLPVTKIGCEISFNKYFYKPAPLRSLAENEADILALDAKNQGFIQSLFDNK